MERVTITDVAKLANVSMSTVSRALRGSDKVSPDTRLRVEQAADQLNFSLSKSASALASGRTMRVLLLVSGALNAWFNSSVLQGVYDVLTPEGYDIVPSFVTNREALDRFFASLPKNRNADAIIITSFSFDTDLHDQLAATGMPVIGLDSPSNQGFDASIGIDDYGALADSVRLLVTLGHRRLTFVRDHIPDDMLYSTTTRGDAFAKAVESLDTPDVSSEIITATKHGANVAIDDLVAELAAKILSSPLRPTGIIVETDELATPLMKELGRQQIRMPQDMSIIGFDDAPVASLMDLTTSHQDPVELGRIAASKTLALMQGEPLEHPHEVLPARLVLRKTTGRVARD